jgi:hypothetical protein
MDEVRLRHVTYTELSALQHEVAISECPRFHTPEFLVIRYSGSYRDGSAGKGDALYIVAAAASAQKAWWAPSTILDFRHLEYRWGDEMEWVTSIAWDPGTRLHDPLAVVVGDECRDALRSLLLEEYESYCVETLEDAYAMCRRKEQEHEQRLKESRDRA